MDPLTTNTEMMLQQSNASPGTAKPSKKLFSFGKKKKRKPVCTCHLAYSSGSRLYGNSEYGPSSPYLGVPDYGTAAAAVGQSVATSNGDCTKNQPGYYFGSGGNNSRQYGPPPSSPVAGHHSHPNTPHHHHHHAQHPIQYLDGNNCQYLGVYGYGNGACQDYPLVSSMTNLSLNPSGTSWDAGGGGGNGNNSAAALYQLEQHHHHSTTTSSSRYRKMLITGGPQTDQKQPDPYGTYGLPPEMYAYKKQQQQYEGDPASYGNPTHRRRWSDGSNSRFGGKSEAESYRQEDSKAAPSELYLAATKGYLPNCDCSTCRSRGSTGGGGKHRPKVSFGPSMMYPMGDAGPYDPSIPDPKNSKQNTPWSKLTTELLPLDTQIPLQMMSDSALVCTII